MLSLDVAILITALIVCVGLGAIGLAGVIWPGPEEGWPY